MPPKLDESGNPVLDGDGKPVMIDDAPTVTIPQAQYDTMQQNIGRLDYLERPGGQFAESAPIAPTGPTPAEQLGTQVASINTEIATIGQQIDEAITGGKPVAELIAKSASLTERKASLQTDFKLADVTSQGLNTISQLTSRIVADQMPYLSIPEVKRDYEGTLVNMSPAQKASPDAHKIAYNLACGQNTDKIYEVKTEEANRAQDNDVNVQGGGGGTGTARTPSTPAGNEGANPTFVEHFGQDMVDRITTQGKSPDEWARHLGYKDGQAYVDFAIEQEREEGAA